MEKEQIWVTQEVIDGLVDGGFYAQCAICKVWMCAFCDSIERDDTIYCKDCLTSCSSHPSLPQPHWHGIWIVLVHDVAETRQHREILRSQIVFVEIEVDRNVKANRRLEALDRNVEFVFELGQPVGQAIQAGRFVQWEKPAEFNAILRDFLSDRC